MKKLKLTGCFLFILSLQPLVSSAMAPPGMIEGSLEEESFSQPLPNPKGVVDRDSWANYLHDRCALREGDGGAWRQCEDLSVSYVQPPSQGAGGWEGKCGQTAGSNLLYGFCDLRLDPESDVAPYMVDWTPGVRPGTFLRGLRGLFSDNKEACFNSRSWAWYHSGSQQTFISAIRSLVKKASSQGKRLTRILSDGTAAERSPLALLIRNPGSHTLHWVTLVDVEEERECMALVNHWDNQYKVPCTTLAKWSKGVRSSYPFLFRAYNIVTLENIR